MPPCLWHESWSPCVTQADSELRVPMGPIIFTKKLLGLRFRCFLLITTKLTSKRQRIQYRCISTGPTRLRKMRSLGLGRASAPVAERRETVLTAAEYQGRCYAVLRDVTGKEYDPLHLYFPVTWEPGRGWYFRGYCDKIADKGNPGRSEFRIRVIVGKPWWLTGAWSSWSHCPQLQSRACWILVPGSLLPLVFNLPSSLWSDDVNIQGVSPP